MTSSSKAHGITPIVKCSIIERVFSKTLANYCKLSLYIIRSIDDNNFLNKKSELVNVKRNETND